MFLSYIVLTNLSIEICLFRNFDIKLQCKDYREHPYIIPNQFYFDKVFAKAMCKMNKMDFFVSLALSYFWYPNFRLQGIIVIFLLNVKCLYILCIEWYRRLLFLPIVLKPWASLHLSWILIFLWRKRAGYLSSSPNSYCLMCYRDIIKYYICNIRLLV